LERTHLLKHDLDWAPRSYRVLSRVVGVTVAAAPFGALAAFMLATHSHFDGGSITIFSTMVPGGLLVGDRAARALIGRRLRSLARGEVDVARLREQEDGELVHVRGKVRAARTISAFLDGSPAVFRRMIFELDDWRYRQGWRSGPIVHEGALDFALVDASGESITVEVEGARLLAHPARSTQGYDQGDFLALPLPPGAATDIARRRRAKAVEGKPTKPVKASEILPRDGDEVEVVGYKSRQVDPTVATLSRETPMRASLRSGKQLPLLILPVRPVR
jgi:hypothetical protein